MAQSQSGEQQLPTPIPIQNTKYSPTTWKAGDTVTSAKLNKIELGILNAGGALVVNADENGYLDKTWQEICDGDYYFIVMKYSDGNDAISKQIQPIFAVYRHGTSMCGIDSIYFDHNGKEHQVITSLASTPDDYPRIQFDDDSSESSGTIDPDDSHIT